MDSFTDVFINPILLVVYALVAPLAFIRMTQASLLLMTSRGDREQVQRAQAIFKGAVVGLIFTLFAVWIVAFLARAAGIPEFS